VRIGFLHCDDPSVLQGSWTDRGRRTEEPAHATAMGLPDLSGTACRAAGGSRPADHGGELIEDPWQAFNSANACTEAK